MNAADLWDKIRDRAAADTGLGGLFQSGSELITAFYYARLLDTSAMPYCSFNIAADSDVSAFSINVSQAIFRISTYVQSDSPTVSGWDPTLRGSQIVHRLYGSSAAGSLAPSYGFHRFTPTLAGGWTAGAIQYKQTFEEHGDDYFSWVMEFGLPLSR